MRAQLGRVWALAAIAAAIAGCNCDSNGEPDAGEPLYDAENFCQELAKRQCDFAIRCQGDPRAGTGGFDVTSAFGNVVPESERARCEAAIASARDCRKIAEGLAAGRATVSDVRFTTCLDLAWPDDYCARDAIAAVVACRNLGFLEPGVDDGAACALDAECRSGFCDGAAPGTDACGTCRAPGGDGFACTRDAMCDPDTHYCPGPDGTAGTCTRYTAVGQACSNDPNSPAAAEQEECGPGNVCAFGASVTLGTRCAAGRLEGEPCDLSTQLPRLQCLRSGRGMFELICAATPNGNRCVRTQALPGGPCGGGEIAFGSFAPPLCPETQYCNASQQCVDKLAAGVACADDGQCAAGHVCRAPAGGGATVCTALSGIDGACADTPDCRALLGCDGGTCQPALALDTEPCDGTRTCASGYCDATASTCVALAANGGGCSVAEQCVSGVCSGTCQQACWQR